MIVLSTVFGHATDALEPTARNSNLLPVKANGEVRLRSLVCFGICGRVVAPSSRRAALHRLLRVARLELVEDVGQHVAEEDRHDRRRSLVGAEAMVIGRARDRAAQQLRMHIHRADHRAEEGEELHVRVRVVARVEQVHARVGRQRPVVVLARAVDAREGLLMHQAREAMALGGLLEHAHGDHLMVDRDIGVLECRRELELAGGDLVVARLDGHAELEQPLLDLGHVAEHALRDRAEVVVLELLPLRCGRADERAAADEEVGPRRRELAVDEEVLLLDAERRDDLVRALVRAEDAQDAHRLLRHGLDRAEKRSLLVEGLARVAHEHGGDAQRRLVARAVDERRARRVPGGVAARLVGVADAAVREARRIGLALDQLRAAELLDGAAIRSHREKRIVLLRGRARERLEPVAVVGGAVLERPVLHCAGDRVRDLRVERRPRVDRALQVHEHIGRKPLEHHIASEDERSEGVRGAGGHCGVLGLGAV
jgi:hypothetical protein